VASVIQLPVVPQLTATDIPSTSQSLDDVIASVDSGAGLAGLLVATIKLAKDAGRDDCRRIGNHRQAGSGTANCTPPD
jgi:hypothetical protein